MIIENTGKKVLLLRGYMGMSVVLILLTVTLHFQVSCNTLPRQLMHTAGMIQSFFLHFCFIEAGLMAALLQHGAGLHLHFLFCQWSRYVCQSTWCLNALF